LKTNKQEAVLRKQLVTKVTSGCGAKEKKMRKGRKVTGVFRSKTKVQTISKSVLQK